MNSLPLSTAKSSKTTSGTLTLKGKTLTLKQAGSIPVIIKKRNSITKEISAKVVIPHSAEPLAPELLNTVAAAKIIESVQETKAEELTEQSTKFATANEALPLSDIRDSSKSATNDQLVSSALPITDSTPEARSFYSIYKDLHIKFPTIINFDKPVLLAVGIRNEMSKETGVSSVILKKWIAWYCRKSNYYDLLHKEGALRFNLDGSEAGVVTVQHQEKMDKHLEKVKSYKSLLKTQSADQIAQDINSTNAVDAPTRQTSNDDNIKSK